ncbi:hypothetical protein [Streptomyces sp. TLI_185]|uniref:hypothetical protein n=1 Tax=Streptomyces sp. TLI_185 TaxID=2485151 RepID=UPI000F50E849|nr:hypothetical protein [Streptomyces sp. TLI_185]RPF34958.1 hypothetical protein EDD92_4943 [Streptomyces sp. TLI_185]
MRWGDRPIWVRCVAGAYVIGFLEGAGAHAYFLATGGLHTYGYAPMPVQLLFHALLLLDPLVALLIVRARPSGALLAAAVMLLDLAGNWDGTWHAVLADPAAYLRPAGLLPITVFGIFVVFSALPLRRGLANARSAG